MTPLCLLDYCIFSVSFAMKHWLFKWLDKSFPQFTQLNTYTALVSMQLHMPIDCCRLVLSVA